VKTKRRKEMRKPKWHAKVFSIIVALAFVLSLLPLTAPLVAARDVRVGFDSYPSDFAKAGETVGFSGSISGATATAWEWHFGDGSPTAYGQYVSHAFYPSGQSETFTVSLHVSWSGGSQWVSQDILVDWGLITEPTTYPFPDYYPYDSWYPSGIDSQTGYNVLESTGIFWVPNEFQDYVLAWHFLPGAGLPGSGTDYVVAGGNTGIGLDGFPPPYPSWLPGPLYGLPIFPWVQVQSGTTAGELEIVADIDMNRDGVKEFSLSATKKWGDINGSELQTMEYYDGRRGEWVYSSCPGESEITWYEGCTSIDLPPPYRGMTIERCKQQLGMAYLAERVIGTFNQKNGAGNVIGTFEHPADGAVVHMFLLDGNAPVDSLPQSEAAAIAGGWSADELLAAVNKLQGLYMPRCVGFYDGDVLNYTRDGRAIHVTKVSGDLDLNGNGVIEDPDEMGWTGNILLAECEEAVKIIMVATYPGQTGEELPVFAEICSWNFWTQQMEKVPQVAWAGEKVVLEKQFGYYFSGYPVVFNLELGSCGSLYPVGQGEPRGAQQVATYCDNFGVARVILESETPCESHVTASLYGESPQPINQAGFIVYFLKFEDVTLGNVEGEREGHDSGQFVLPDGSTNPWADTGEDAQGLVGPVDPVTGELNVSADALLRARVRGWFVGADKSNRPERVIDSNHNGVIDIHDEVLPKGRWVLPDDWPYLAGTDPTTGDTQWTELRPHWDIMTQPDDNIMSVIDKNLDKKEALGDYVAWNSTSGIDVPGALIAERKVIGPFSLLDTYTPEVNWPLLSYKTIVRNGKLNWWDCPMPPAKIVFEILQGPGYFKDCDKADVYYEWVDTDWDPNAGEGKVYTNPYYFEMIPASPLIPPFNVNSGYDWDSWNDAYGPYPFWHIFNQLPGTTPSDPEHPTKVEVYSDNHGEAMVWLNGDWNLDLSTWQVDKNPPYDAYDVPTGTTVGTTTVVAKVDYPYMRGYPDLLANTVTKTWTWGKELKGYSEYVQGSTTEKRVLIFVCDRDGFPALGENITWKLEGTNGGYIESYLAGTNGTDILGLGYPAGQSRTRLPSPSEAAAFEAKFGTDCHYAIAGIIVHNSLGAVCDLTIEFDEREGVIVRDVILDYNAGGADIFWQGAGDPEVGLVEGWQNVSWADQTAPAVADAVAPLGDAFVAIWHYNAFTKEWLAYKAGAPDYANDNFQMKYLDAYWIQVTRDIAWNQGA
jgi:hypothetical protein